MKGVYHGPVTAQRVPPKGTRGFSNAESQLAMEQQTTGEVIDRRTLIGESARGGGRKVFAALRSANKSG